jgi:hypothetical protein
MRICPYCAAPLRWRCFGHDDAVERPWCEAHGPLSIWRVVDWKREEVVSIAHLSEDVGAHYLATPLPIESWRPACARWQIAKRRFLRRSPTLLSIDLAHLAHPPTITIPPSVDRETPRRESEATCSILKDVTEGQLIADLIYHARPPAEIRMAA